jgi:hypothetical protein
MEVEIMDHDSKKSKAIRKAAANEWPFAEWEKDEDGLGCSAESSLCGGEREEEFAERLTVAIWRANGAYCDVLITASYLEIEPPSEEHHLDEGDYERLLGNA